MHSQELGDYIGAESCLDFRANVVDIVPNGGSLTNHPRRRRWRDAAGKDYPPAIPSLARTENLPSLVPWVMKKYSMSDGRLVIKGEKVKRREYFQAHRSNGRLVLTLVPLNDGVRDEEEAKSDFRGKVAVPGEEINSRDECISDPMTEEVHSESDDYSIIGINPCSGFQVAAAAAFTPPVRT